MVFYELCKDLKYKDVKYSEGTDWEGIVCPKDKGHQRPGNRIGQLKIDIKSRKLSDFMTTFLSEWIITDKVANVLAINSITGYELRPIKVCNLELSYNLWEFVVTGKGGEAHPDSGIYMKEECSECGLKVYSAYENGIIVNVSEWDGSDIFTVTGYSRHILVTEKVKNNIVKHKLTGVQFVPSHELKWPEGVIKP